MTPEAIAEALKREMLNGRIPAGAELRQEALAERFGVSRIPIRDALRSLAAEGLALIVPGRGATVIRLSAAEIEEVFDLRIMLECDCIERVAAAADEQAIKLIDRVRAKAELDAGTPEWSEGDWSFHQAMYEHAARPRQLELIRGLRQTCRLGAAGYEALPEARTRWLSDHTDIVEYLRSRDARGASAALRKHLEAARDHLLARITSCPPSSPPLDLPQQIGGSTPTEMNPGRPAQTKR
jgi:DNA-binding GntR family transcriptional regulator